MTDYLIFRLYAPLVSWGEIAVGESRYSATHPSRSALLGLLGAALGLERADGQGQRRLSQSVRFGIKLECAGQPLRDYHTVQVGVAPRKFEFRSRRQELAAQKVETMLSMREYRCDSLALIAVEAAPNATWSLTELAQALARPHFLIYFGRKSCPPAHPLHPQLITAETLRGAFEASAHRSLLDHAEDKPWPSAADRHFFRPGPARFFWEEGMVAGMAADFETVRHDEPLSRERWQFSPRREWVGLAAGGGA